MPPSEPSTAKPYRILCIDGGGAKGFYSLGVLREIEAMLPRPLHESFDLIYGTSTGSIIGALVSLGKSVPEIQALYTKHVPEVMKERKPSGKSAALSALADEIFGAQ